MRLKIAITGANGYIASAIREKLDAGRFSVVAVPRQLLYQSSEKLAEKLAGCHAVLNLAGVSILKRWSPQNRSVIYFSRVQTTRNLASAVALLPKESRPHVFISASAIGIYKEDMLHSEKSNTFANHFAARVVADWEDASADLPKGVRRVIFRTGLVLGKGAQIVKKLLPVFRMGVGGVIGSGKQAFPFVHIDDAVSAYIRAITDSSFHGVYNLVAPEQVTNRDFTDQFARLLNRWAVVPVPAFALKLIYGKASLLLLESPRVEPEKLLQTGFHFLFPTLESTLGEIIKPAQNKKDAPVKEHL